MFVGGCVEEHLLPIVLHSPPTLKIKIPYLKCCQYPPTNFCIAPGLEMKLHTVETNIEERLGMRNKSN